MSTNDRYLAEDFRFASRDELVPTPRARFTDRFRIEVKPERILGNLLSPQMRETLRFLGDYRTLTIAGGASFLVFAFLAVDILSPDASWVASTGVLVLAAIGLTLSYYSVLGALWVMCNSSRRPWLAALAGTLALMLGLALPMIEANTTRVGSDPEQFTSCRANVTELWSLIQQYEQETGKPLDYGKSEALRPVWERYRNTDAECFFCPEASRTQTLIATGISLASAEFRDISFTGCLFEPWLRDADVHDPRGGPPMLWEKEANHGIGGLQVYTSGIGPHSASPSVLYRRIAGFRIMVAEQAAEREALAAAVSAASEAEPTIEPELQVPVESTEDPLQTVRAQMAR